MSYPHDPHSHARPNEIAVQHLDLDVTVDFDARRLTGRATYTLDRSTPGATTVVLDTWDLDIRSVTAADGTALEHGVGEPHPLLGRPLTIVAGSEDTVVVDYATGEGARALQWLDPAQTTGERFLFTQSQPILARSWIPCQDTPAVRHTYRATVRVPPELLAVMSAENSTERTADGVYSFAMPQPVPSYLVALAVGDLEFRPLGERAGVYAEPAVVDAAAWEFADTERMMEAAERLYGPYRWGRYDLLVLPPSFPYGGMENPRLTFVTPTLLAGDRSLVTVVAHELAHSWSGNLVTNATWDDIWLNEGFTVYFETRIDEELYGADYTAMLLRLGRQALETEIATLPARDTWLSLALADRDPEGGPDLVAYEKGSLFLRMIEHAVGRERLDAFLADYFDRFAFQSMDTATFLALLRAEVLEPAGVGESDVQIEAWVYGPGVPTNAPDFPSDAFDRVDRQAAALVAGTAAADLDTAGWAPQQWVHLLRALPADVPHPILADLDRTFGFSGQRNIEVLTAWLELAIGSEYVWSADEADAAVAGFLARHGRSLYLRRVYTKLAATPRGLERAREIFASAAAGYHPVARAGVARILDAA
ncbi:M1 family metallopeptidase [Nocardioides sp. HM23]|uniref:M1 family metallopeptidase n=1 Tax=Nocardioides bizhenqiangii TaxID=3095076 RepID=UPI002ACB0425|nr:M1 family metallopeptidase [Nocardioides sp. HM23]MDZ5619666.1 M1 family metallopeptidase [Nocardioides sp. HM23]